jgi:hypothetical protein
MSSGAPPEWLPLDRDLPATAEDVAALERVRRFRALDTGTYLAFLSAVTPTSTATLRTRGRSGGPPFELRDTTARSSSRG